VISDEKNLGQREKSFWKFVDIEGHNDIQYTVADAVGHPGYGKRKNGPIDAQDISYLSNQIHLAVCFTAFYQNFVSFQRLAR
jgi:hypothetical protein